MADPQIITTLTTKRDQLIGRIEAYEREIEAIRRDLAAINATLALFQQDGEIRPHMSISRLFKRGELFAICKAALDAAGKPLDTRELAQAVLAAKGLDKADRVLRKAVAFSVVSIMRMRERRGGVVGAGRRGNVRLWALCYK